MDPESLFKQGKQPGPLQELDFWGAKAADMDSIYQQLHADKIKKVIDILRVTQSTYLPSFEKLIEDVLQARNEARDNFKYLSPLRPNFEKLRVDSASPVEFSEAPTIFKKLFHMIFLVWTKSQFYNTPNRLVVLIREVCNDLIDLVGGVSVVIFFRPKIPLVAKKLWLWNQTKPLTRLKRLLEFVALSKSFTLRTSPKLHKNIHRINGKFNLAHFSIDLISFWNDAEMCWNCVS